MSDDAHKPPQPELPLLDDEGLDAALDALLPTVPPRREPSSRPARGAGTPAPATRSSLPVPPAATPPPAGASAARAAPPARAAAPDRGAQTAYRALPRRTPPDLARPEHVFGAPDPSARAELLEHLSTRATGSARTGLRVAAAEAFARTGEHARARALYEQAYMEDASDALLLRELRKHALAERDLGRAAELLTREAQLPLAAEERAHVLLLLAELELIGRGDTAAAERAATQAEAARATLAGALALYSIHARAGRDREAADALQRAAQLWPDPDAQSGLRVLAARLLLRVGDTDAAVALCQRAHDQDPHALDALLCWARIARARGDAHGVQTALGRLARDLPNAELRAQATRARARLYAAEGDPATALRVLESARELPELRLRVRLARAAGDGEALQAALGQWADAAGGNERALALHDLAELHLAGGAVAEAQAALDAAAEADAGSLLVRTLQAAVARTSGAAAPLPSTHPDANDAEVLEAAARLALDGGASARELALLAGVAPRRSTAAAIALDAAVEVERWSVVRGALAREAQQLAGEEREAALLLRDELFALHPGKSTAAPPTAGDPGTALGLLHAVYAAPNGSAAGEAWLALAARTEGELAATAATLAGDQLALDGRSREAYELALTAVPGHLPACFALEPLLFERGDDLAAQRLHGALARSTRDPQERAARLLRAARLARGDLAPAVLVTAYRELAAISPLDALLCDAELVPEGTELQAALADALEGAGHAAGSALADLAALRAAGTYERAGEPGRAAVLYRAQLDRHAGSGAHAELGLERALADAGLTALLVEHLARAQLHQGDATARAEACERLAFLHTAQGDDLRAARSFRALQILEPGHLPALRALQRHAMREGDLGGLAAVAEKLAARTHDPRERGAQLRLSARALALRGDPPQLDQAQPGELGLWHALEQERAARNLGEPVAIASAVQRLCAELSDPDERASYALRAAEALESTAAADAVSMLAPFATAAPDHPFAYEALARMRQTAGDEVHAAADYERAAGATRVPQRAARLWYRAATLWQAAVPHAERTRAALEAVMRADPTYRDSFARLRRVLSAEGDEPALAALLEARARAGGDPQVVADLQVERSRVLLDLGREPEARAALARALELEPSRIDALRSAAELDMLASRFPEAAQTLIQLARVAQDRVVLRDAFFDLGRIYTERLPDLRRAEIAFARAVALDPDDVEAAQRLMQVFRERREHDKALRVCERLVELSRDEAEREQRSIELASILEDLGDDRRAERALNAQRERTPASPAILSTLADLYARQQDTVALAVHLDRSAHALRMALQDEPGDAARWSALCALLVRRGRSEAAASAAAFARDLGLADARAEEHAAQHRGMGAAAFDSTALDRLWPELLDARARALVRWLEPVADSLLGAPQVQRIDKQPDTLRDAIAIVRPAFGLSRLEVVLSSGFKCIPLRRDPWVVAIGARALERCSSQELVFLLLRAVSAAHFGLLAAMRAEPGELAALIAAARRLGEPADEAQDDHESRAEWHARFEQQLNPKRREELQALAKQLGRDDLPLGALALEIGARAAFLAQGALGTALRGLVACAPELPGAEQTAFDPLAALVRSPEARALLRFALSDAYLDLQRRARESAGTAEG